MLIVTNLCPIFVNLRMLCFHVSLVFRNVYFDELIYIIAVIV